MKYFFILNIILLSFSCRNNSKNSETDDFLSGNSDEITLNQLPEAPRWINDSEGIFTESETDSINELCNSIFDHTGHFAMIHTISDFNPYNNLNEYTNAIDEAWSDKGQKYFIIIISSSLEEVRIIHGEITESLLSPDFTDKVMQNDMFPNFKNNKYGYGIIMSLQSYFTSLTKK